jgi:hypothetical protein
MNIGYCPMNVLLMRSRYKTSRIWYIMLFFTNVTILIFIRIIQIGVYLGPITVKCHVPVTSKAVLLILVNLRLQEVAVTL